jgi:hypothetical protein
LDMNGFTLTLKKKKTLKFGQLQESDAWSV